jgi:E3 ubiquitin-protein ligase HUWE1
MSNKLKSFIKNINNILFPCWEQLNNLLLDINFILKDNQDIIVPKLNRLIPYLETFITLAHLQFISTNSSSQNLDKNAFIFEKKFVPNNDPPSTVASPIPQAKNEIDVFVEYFYEFCEKNKKIINFILRQYPKMFTNELILKISSLLDLENKQKYFRHSLKKLPASRKYISIHVRRNGPELLSDSFDALNIFDAKDLRGRLIINFQDEEAIDEGGVKREWLTLLSKEMFNPNYMLFTLAKNGTTYSINGDSGKYNPEHLSYFEFIGKIMAKAIFDGMMIDCYFTRIIYKLIIGSPISYHDMEDYDPVYFNSIKWLLENDFTNSETYLTYSYNHDNLGEIQTVDLIENGRNIDVTEANKFDYVQRLCSSKLYDTIKPQIDALLKGFYQIIPQKLISIFDHRELELVISGMPTIDIKDWKNNTIYENYNETSDVVVYFWEIIESFDNDERAEFLQFVTGSSKVPLEGFSALQGIGGINKFKISKVFDKNYDRLPTAHTCMNQLDLPEYPSKEILYERLRLAIKEGKNSFGFA